MKKSRCTVRQIDAVFKPAERGIPVPAHCRVHGIRSCTFYRRRSAFGGMDVRIGWPS